MISKKNRSLLLTFTTPMKYFAILLYFLFNIPKAANAQSLTRFVDPKIGSAKAGNVFIGPTRPYGLVKPGPDCSKMSNSGYEPDMKQPVLGFSQLHVSGTGGGPKYGNISVMPISGNLKDIHQSSLRSDEQISLGCYRVKLKKWNIATEITASAKTSYYRFRYAAGLPQFIVLDAGAFLGEKALPETEAQHFVGSEIRMESSKELSGYSRIRGGWNNGGPYTVYFYAIFDKPFNQISTWKSDKLTRDQKQQTDSGEPTGALVSFSPNSGRQLQLKIGISFISTAKAKQNATETNSWDLEQVKSETVSNWENLLKRIKVSEDASDELKKMLYTGIYHTMLMPVDRTGENPLWKDSRPYYDDFYTIWDTFRSSGPLITLIDPERQTSIINSLLNIYDHDKYLPEGRSGNSNGRTQGGSNAEVMLCDAYVKGLKGIDYAKALKAMIWDATMPPGGNEEKEGRGGLPDYNTLGYVSSSFPRAGSRTMEYSYDDFCIGQLAGALGDSATAKLYYQKSNNWRNLWRAYINHGANGFIMPKNNKGEWLDSVTCTKDPFNNVKVLYTPLSKDWRTCTDWWAGFTYEGTSWEYSLYVPHDVGGLIRQTGGRKAFVNRLDTLFNNRYYNVGNEPSFLTPCLYHWAGRPDLSTKTIREVIKSNFNTTPGGIPGNDDSGAMSSWLTFHLLGLYPNAGQDYYLINTPFFKESAIQVGPERNFKIKALNLSSKNIYITGARLNGQPYPKSWITHADLVKGGELVLELGDQPTTWGTQQSPPSLSNH